MPKPRNRLTMRLMKQTKKIKKTMTKNRLAKMQKPTKRLKKQLRKKLMIKTISRSKKETTRTRKMKLVSHKRKINETNSCLTPLSTEEI